MSISFMTSASMLNMSYQTSSSQTSIVNNGTIGTLNAGGGGNFMSTFGALDQAASGGSFASAYAGNGKAFAMAGSTGGGATAMAAAGPNGAFASAGTQGGQRPCNPNQQGNQQQDPMQAIMGFMQMMAQVMGLGQQQQPQQNDPMAGNKQMGQNMEQMGKKMQLMGGDLKDDGILNHSNKPKGPGQNQQMMMAMLGMIMQSIMGGDNQQQNQNQFNTPFQMLT